MLARTRWPSVVKGKGSVELGLGEIGIVGVGEGVTIGVSVALIADAAAICMKAANAAVFGEPVASYNPKSPSPLLSCQLNTKRGPVHPQAFA